MNVHPQETAEAEECSGAGGYQNPSRVIIPEWEVADALEEEGDASRCCAHAVGREVMEQVMDEKDFGITPSPEVIAERKKKLGDNRMTHKILGALVREGTGFLEISNVLDRLWQFFGTRIDLDALGYRTPLEFVEACLTDYPNTNVDIVEVFRPKESKDQQLVTGEPGHFRYEPVKFLLSYHMKGAKENWEEYKQKTGCDHIPLTVTEAHRPMDGDGLSQYALSMDNIGYRGDGVFPGFESLVKVTAVFTPMKFYCVMDSDERNYALLLQMLQNAMTEYKGPKGAQVEPLLSAGMPVVVHKPKDNRSKWSRALTYSVVPNETQKNQVAKFFFRDFDTGEWLTEPIDNIHLMPKSVAKVFPAFAILCQLDPETVEFQKEPFLERKMLGRGRPTWTQSEKTVFKDLVAGRCLSITFGRKQSEDTENDFDGMSFHPQDTKKWNVMLFDDQGNSIGTLYKNKWTELELAIPPEEKMNRMTLSD